jgi:hypothetical protein
VLEFEEDTMRVVWAGLLVTGLLLVGATVYEDATTDGGVTTSVMEDGTPMPSPNGTPPPPPRIN